MSQVLNLDELTPEVRKIWDESSPTLKANVEAGLRRYDHKLTDLTCVTCPVIAECRHYRFDLYNTDGDCLAMK